MSDTPSNAIAKALDAYHSFPEKFQSVILATVSAQGVPHTSYAPYTCTQCAEAWCMVACPVKAITVSAVGAKVVLDEVCVGCKLCTIACPV